MQLVIAEKPSVAESIADVIGATERTDGYFKGNGYFVSWCFGHLVELAQPDKYNDEWKNWNYESLPIIPHDWKYIIKNDTKKQYETLCMLLKDSNVTSVICATDAGREGELIFRLLVETARCTKPMKRLWISSMEETAIRNGFKNLRPSSEYDDLYESARCRQEADWIVGINGTRLFTVLYGGKTLKVGRVQTPTLSMIVEREAQIMNFKSQKYYAPHILIKGKGIDAITKYTDRKEEAEKIAEICHNGKAQITSVKKEEKKILPPKLYDLTTLQRDANKILGFTAKQTLEYTQSLYEKKLVTYPRTDSRFLSDDMEKTAMNVIKAVFASSILKMDIMFNPYIKRILNSEKVTDHHAIIPTVEIVKTDINSLPETEKRILHLISVRLLCATGMTHIYDDIKVEIECEGYSFSCSRKRVTENGWRIFEDFYNRKKCERNENLSEISEGMRFEGEEVQSEVSEHITVPPKRFTEDSLLAAMERSGCADMEKDVERKGLGTPATRAEIIDKLVRDNFIERKKKQLIPTEDGIKLITILPDMIKSAKLTADWENALTLVAKGEMTRAEFMQDIEKMIINLVHTYHEISEEQRTLFK